MNRINQILESWKNEYLPNDFNDVKRVYYIQEAVDKNILDKFILYKITTDTFQATYYKQEMYPDAIAIPRTMENLFFQNAIGDIEKTVSCFSDVILSRGINKIALYSDSYFFRGRRLGKFLQVMKEYGWIPKDTLSYIEGSARIGTTYIIFNHDNT